MTTMIMMIILYRQTANADVDADGIAAAAAAAKDADAELLVSGATWRMLSKSKSKIILTKIKLPCLARAHGAAVAYCTSGMRDALS